MLSTLRIAVATASLIAVAETAMAAGGGSMQPAPTPSMQKFVAGALAADRIDDPLARCLAFPDLPDSHWQPGFAQAECHRLFDAAKKHVTLDDIADRLGHGDTKGLDARFAEDLALHFSRAHRSEVIHLDFGAIGKTERADELTKQWLALDPHSAFAMAARAAYLVHVGVDARGEGSINETSPENMIRMHETFRQALPLYRRALAIEPRLMPAYDGIMQIQMMDGTPAEQAKAFKASHRIDPACWYALDRETVASEPRWGGSFERMQKLEESVRPLVANHPELASFLYISKLERARTLFEGGDYAGARTALKTIAHETPASANSIYGDVLEWIGQGYDWDDAANMIEGSRFDWFDTKASEGRGSVLLVFRRPDLAVLVMHRAPASEKLKRQLWTAHGMLSTAASAK